MIKGLPEKLKEQREKYHYSQKYVADQLHVSPSIISGYETGERTPSTEKLLALSYLYHCSTDYLLGRKHEDPETLVKINGLKSHQINALIRFIDSMKS